MHPLQQLERLIVAYGTDATELVHAVFPGATGTIRGSSSATPYRA